MKKVNKSKMDAKLPAYGGVGKITTKLMLNPKTNNQCIKAGMNDARDTQHS